MLTMKTSTPLKMGQWIKNIEKSAATLDYKNNLLYPAIQGVVDKSTIRNFQSGGRPAWKSRTAEYYWPILRKTQKMERKTLSYIRAKWNKSGQLYALNIKSAYYGRYQQRGTHNRNGTVRLPPRPFVAIQAVEKKEIHQIIALVFGIFKGVQNG